MSKLGDANYVPDTAFLSTPKAEKYHLQFIIQLIVIAIAAVVYAIAMNMFFIPHQMISGGFAGVGMIIGYLLKYNIGTIIFLLNIPIIFLSYRFLSKKITFLSAFFVTISTLLMNTIPVYMFSYDILLSAVFGGVLYGAACGVVFRFASSTGGFDIVSLILSKYKDMSVGNIILIFNTILLIIAGFLFGWDISLYTMISRFVSSKVLDRIHSKHVKLTVTIITENGPDVQQALLANGIRGITMVDAVGAYTEHEKKMLYTVITRYELSQVIKIIRTVDEDAFINVTKTMKIVGHFKRT